MSIGRVELPSLKSRCSEVEWETRVNLAACYRLLERMGLSDLTNTHTSARIPGTEHFLINPYHWTFDEVTASSLVKIDIEGQIIDRAADDLDINPAGYVIHSAVHQARPDVQCVIHTHTRAGTALSALKCGLLPISQKAMRFHGRIAYHQYEGPAINLEERARLQRHLGDKNALILFNHGLLTCASTTAEAFNAMLSLDRACQIQIDAMSCNTELETPSEEIQNLTARLFDPTVRRPYGVKEWPAMLRMLDRKDPSFRD
ncbi:class II aldolase/adducin family protein [Variovorax sp. J22R115]|uniref:class II aldolase/adducin family protein n=1 Tax=Variovorax sp. J22R115 TaxID=3053509 RepID=UPI002577E624|nr:class II aldolase/adducin family protein [Variovorax sp. J22R115]MDM0053578.1 class II aldolase/adducin family protein [Variovorax sp. J22R115]